MEASVQQIEKEQGEGIGAVMQKFIRHTSQNQGGKNAGYQTNASGRRKQQYDADLNWKDQHWENVAVDVQNEWSRTNAGQMAKLELDRRRIYLTRQKKALNLKESAKEKNENEELAKLKEGTDKKKETLETKMKTETWRKELRDAAETKETTQFRRFTEEPCGGGGGAKNPYCIGLYLYAICTLSSRTSD